MGKRHSRVLNATERRAFYEKHEARKNELIKLIAQARKRWSNRHLILQNIGQPEIDITSIRVSAMI